MMSGLKDQGHFMVEFEKLLLSNPNLPAIGITVPTEVYKQLMQFDSVEQYPTIEARLYGVTVFEKPGQRSQIMRWDDIVELGDYLGRIL